MYCGLFLRFLNIIFHPTKIFTNFFILSFAMQHVCIDGNIILDINISIFSYYEQAKKFSGPFEYIASFHNGSPHYFYCIFSPMLIIEFYNIN